MPGQFEVGFFRTFDGLELFYRFHAARKDGGTLVFLHGHGEHSGRYEKFAERLKDLDVSIAGFDYRGHGRSQGEAVYVNHFEEYLRDISAFIDFIRGRYGVQKKIFLLGNSLGGLIAIHWAKREPEKIRALILSSPFLGLRLSKAVVYFNNFMNLFLPHYIYRNPIYPPYLTHDASEVEKYKQDPLIRRRTSARLVHEMFKAVSQVASTPLFNFPFPVFVLMSGDEKVVDPEKTHLFFAKVHAPMKDIKIFPGFYHELFNEMNQTEAFEALRECIRKAETTKS
jgi:lysophospholipase